MRVFAMIFVAAIAAPAVAQVYKCPDAGGRTVIQQMPCANGEVVHVKPASGRGAQTYENWRRELDAEAKTRQAEFNKAIAARTDAMKAINASCDARAVSVLTIGMKKEDALCVKGYRFPKKTNTTQTANGIREQVVYGGFDKFDEAPYYLYFENGKLTSIQK